jgi:hypothetical protein
LILLLLPYFPWPPPFLDLDEVDRDNGVVLELPLDSLTILPREELLLTSAEETEFPEADKESPRPSGKDENRRLECFLSPYILLCHEVEEMTPSFFSKANFRRFSSS